MDDNDDWMMMLMMLWFLRRSSVSAVVVGMIAGFVLTWRWVLFHLLCWCDLWKTVTAVLGCWKHCVVIFHCFPVCSRLESDAIECVCVQNVFYLLFVHVCVSFKIQPLKARAVVAQSFSKSPSVGCSLLLSLLSIDRKKVVDAERCWCTCNDLTTRIKQTQHSKRHNL